MQHEIPHGSEEQLPSIEETIERLIASAKGEVDAYTLLGPHLDSYFTFAPVGERPEASRATFAITKIERTEALELAHELAREMVEDKLHQQEKVRKTAVFTRLKHLVLQAVDYMGETSPENRSHWD